MEIYIGARLRKITFGLRELLQATAKQEQNPKTLATIHPNGVNNDGKNCGVDWFKETLKEALLEAEALGLSCTALGIKRDIAEIKNETTCPVMRIKIEDIERRLTDELSNVNLVFIPQSERNFIEELKIAEHPFPAKFIYPLFDLEEARDCYLVERYTACVHHLMRALEPALSAMAGELGVNSSSSNWGTMIEQMEKEIKRTDAGSVLMKNHPSNYKEAKKYYHDASTNFLFITDPWRNRAAHQYPPFVREKARQIFTHTVSLIKLLAENAPPKT